MKRNGFRARLINAFLITGLCFCTTAWVFSTVKAKPVSDSPLDLTAVEVEASPAYAEGEVLVNWRSDSSAAAVAMMSGLSGLSLAEIREFPVLSETGSGRYFHLRSERLSTAELLAALRNDSRVTAAFPNFRRRLARLPNDPHYDSLWAMPTIGAPRAWDVATGSSAVVVAVLDSGIDYTHEDLRANMWKNPGEIQNNGVDDDGNGFVDDYFGYDFAATNSGANDSDPADSDGHGSHVAGTIAARGNNGIGVAGVNWTARLMALKVLRPNDYIYDSDAVEALEYLIKMKRHFDVNIVAANASFGGSGYNGILENAIHEAGTAGVLFLAAAGNGGDDSIGDDNDYEPFYPASYELANVIAVAATDENDTLADFSNYGSTSVDLAAPGVAIYSTVPFGSGLESRLRIGSAHFETIPMEFAGVTPAGGLTRTIHFCKRGQSAADFPAAVNGNIALIERGDNSFNDKTTRAQLAGAVAAIIYNNGAGNFFGTLGEEGEWIPVVSVSREDGLAIKALGTPVATLVNRLAAYEYYGGTSMATPHVSGAVALLAGKYPNDTALQLKSKIMSGTTPLASLAGKCQSGGRLNLENALLYSVSLTLAVSRRTTRTWLLKKDYAEIDFSAQAFGAAADIYKYVVSRQQDSGAFADIRDVFPSELSGDSFAFIDKYLESGSSYTYRVTALNGSGQTIGVSPNITI